MRNGNWILSLLAMTACAASMAAGGDVIVGFVDDGREDSRVGSKVSLTASTNACNIGNAPVSWRRLPDKRHPAISMNFYRLADGRLDQLAKSWVKHGFYATNQEDCLGIPEMKGQSCQSGAGGSELRPGCSDLYSEDLNADPNNLGPRSRITNPATGDFDGALARDLTGYPATVPPQLASAERVLLVEEAELQVQGARYFVEAQYIVQDDAAAGNSRNSVTYREVKPLLRNGAWVLKNEKPEVRMQPALLAWKEAGAQIAEIEKIEGSAKAYLMVGSKATQVGPGKFRYDYVVYNMNSDAAVQSVVIRAKGVDAATLGFRAVRSNGEIWSNEPWQGTVQGDTVVWSTKTVAQDANANAIRWGASYNFWFVSSVAPTSSDVSLLPFKQAYGTNPSVTRVIAPAP